MARSRARLLLSIAAIAAALPGCARPASESLDLGGGVTVGAISAPAAPADALDANTGAPRPDWPAVAVAVPVDPIARYRSLTRHPALAPPTPRRAGAWPTPASAATRDPDRRALAAEILVAHPLAAIDLILLPARGWSPGATPDPRPAAHTPAPQPEPEPEPEPEFESGPKR